MFLQTRLLLLRDRLRFLGARPSFTQKRQKAFELGLRDPAIVAVAGEASILKPSTNSRGGYPRNLRGLLLIDEIPRIREQVLDGLAKPAEAMELVDRYYSVFNRALLE